MRQRLARLSALALAALAGCGPRGAPELPLERRIPLAEPAATLHVDAAAGVWLGGEGALRRLEDGREAARFATGGDAAPRVAGRIGPRLYLRTGERLRAVDAATGAEAAVREGVRGRVLLDVRGRFLLLAAPSGEVRALDPATLEPLWLWPSLGASSAAALSPEGDRLYAAVSRGEGAWALVARDLQTGREVHGEALSAPVGSLRTGPRGELVAVVGEEGEGAVLSLRPAGGRFGARWRRRTRALGLEGPLEARVQPRGGGVALFSPGKETGLRLLDAETGDLLGAVRGAVRDAAFTPDGSLLYLLSDAEVRIVRVPG